mmetsp:Transcript_495/g.1961  ORF Transcript_495/g.1961 Transcript_495/m.1961 type:complete len:293 (-) Transcript_495:21-899(-)
MGPQRALHQPLLEALLNVPGLVDEPLAVPKVHRAVPHELGQRELLDLALPALQPVASAPLHNNPRWRVRGPAAIHVDGPTLAADVRLLLGLRPARVVGRPEPLVAKPQRDSSRHVGTLAVDCGGGIRAPEVGGVKGQEDPGDRIETEVQKSSSSDLQIVESSHLLRDKKSEVRGDAHDLSEVSRPEDLRHPPRGGKATGPEPLHQEETLLLGQREHRLDLPGVHSFQSSTERERRGGGVVGGFVQRLPPNNRPGRNASPKLEPVADPSRILFPVSCSPDPSSPKRLAPPARQ